MFRKKLFLVSLFAILGILSGYAQNVTFKAFAQSPVVVGQQFRVSYTLTNGDARDFRAPDFAGLDVLMGPSRSTSSSTQIINGSMTSETSVTFTYVLMASSEGSYNISPATVTSKGQQYSSNALAVKVLPQDQSDKASQAGQGVSSAGVSNDNLFLRAIVSKTNVYEQEAVLVTYKIYSRPDISGLTALKLPDFSGLVTQEIEQPQPQQLGMENYKGLNYMTLVVSQRLLYPQRSGEISVGPCEVGVSVRVRNQRRSGSIFDDFFDSYSEVKKDLKAPGFKLNVKALPAGKPAGFAGAVGDFTLKSSITPQQPKSNESITLKLEISGTGNLKYIKTPEVEFPGSFEQFDPKVDNNLNVTTAGVSGTKTIEYLVIPRSEGKFTVPAVNFSFFDTKSNSYKTLSTPEYTLDVAKGKGGGSSSQVNNFTSKENVKLLGQDIRFIRPEFKLSKSGSYYYGSWIYWMCYIIPVIVLGIFFVVYRKRIAENANTSLMKTKKANKVATRRLKQVAVYLRENKKQEYYDELLKAIWGYISDKLSIPLSNLTKDNVQAELTKFGVDQPTIDEIIHILNTCEFARYAPSQDNQMMDKLYNEAVDVINKIESLIKK
ncbi:MAG: BatD family protein [Bacteroidales bacterium]